MFRKKLREHELDDKEIEIEIVDRSPTVNVIGGAPGMDDLNDQLQSIFDSMSSNKKSAKKMKIKEAFKILTEEEASKLTQNDDLKPKLLSLLKITVLSSSMRSTRSVRKAKIEALCLDRVCKEIFCL